MKKEYLILVLVIVSLSIYLLFRQKEHNVYKIPSTPQIDKASITTIEVEGNGKSYKLIKKGDDWFLSRGEFKVENSLADKIGETIGTLKLREMVSESKNYDRYDLDSSKAVKVKAFAGKKLLMELLVGKSASTYNHTYVKIEGDHRVYLASGSFRDHVDKHGKDLRDKLVMSFDKNSVNSIAFKKNGSIISFSKFENKVEKPDTDKSLKGSSEVKVDWKWSMDKMGNREAVESVIEELHSLRCDSYIDDSMKANLTNPFYTVTVMTDKAHTINFFSKRSEKASDYVVLTSDNKTAFLLSSWKAEKIMKDFDELKGIKKDSKK